AAPNLNPIVRLDEQVAAGRFLLELTVVAGSQSAAEQIAPHLLFVLHRRLQLMLGGHATEKAPKLPPEPTRGQAPGGPDLSTLLLQPPDVGQSHAVNLIQEYVPAPPALSDFFMVLQPAGTYELVFQQIGWWPSATEAVYAEVYGGGSPYSAASFGFGSGDTITPVDLRSVGHSAVGYLVTGDEEAAALVTPASGPAREALLGYT